MRRFSVLILIFAICVGSVFADELENRLKNHYVGKAVVTKVNLPKANQPLLYFADKSERFDKELYKLKLDRSGVGLENGIVAIISDISLNGNELQIDLVGVGYELPMSPMRKELLDDSILGFGDSSIKIKSSKNLSEYEKPMNTINGWLSDVVSIRALVTGEGLPEPILMAISKNEVVTGMNRKAVFLSKGEPTEILRSLENGSIMEIWFYEKEDFSGDIVTFKDGRVIAIKEY